MKKKSTLQLLMEELRPTEHEPTLDEKKKYWKETLIDLELKEISLGWENPYLVPLKEQLKKEGLLYSDTSLSFFIVVIMLHNSILLWIFLK